MLNYHCRYAFIEYLNDLKQNYFVFVVAKQRRPKFLKCFKDQKVPIGKELRLEAQVEAYPPPEVKWFKDGVPVRASSNVHFENHPDGRIALIVDIMKPENAGKYELKVT